MDQGATKEAEAEEADRIAALEAEVAELRRRLAARASGPADEIALQAIADSIDQMIWSTTPDGRHDYFNRRWHDYTGVPEGSPDADGWNGLFHPQDKERVLVAWRHSLATGESYHMEYRLRHRSGEYRWVLGRAEAVRDADGRITRWYGTCTDIQELKQTEQALRESEERLRRANVEQQAILSQLAEGVIVADAAGRIVFVNEAAARIHGVRSLDVAPDEYSETYHLFTEDGRPYPSHELPLARAVATGQPVDEAAWRIRTPDGRDVLARGSAHPVLADDGVRLGTVLTLRDDTARADAEAALRQSEERLQRALDAGQIGDYEWDLRTGETRWSENLMEIVGLPRDTKIRGDEVFELIHPDDRAMAQEAVQRAVDGGDQIETSYRVIGGDGVTRWIASRGRVVRDAAGAPLRLVGVNYDVTAARQADERLRETEARLQTLTDNLPGVVVYQLVTSRDMSERSYVYVSANATKVLGVTAEEAMADPAALMGRIDPEQLEGVVEAERQAAATMKPMDIELSGRASRGELRTRIISSPRELPDGRLIWDGIVIDITGRKLAQERAERTAALLSAVGAASPDLIFAKDIDLKLLYANEATCRIIGIPQDRVVGASSAEFATTGQESEALDANDRQVIESGQTQVVEEAFTSPDGTRRIFRSAKAPMRDAEGAVIGLVGVATDITDRVAAEDLLRRSEERLREESRTLETLNRTGAALAAELDLEKLVQRVTDAGVELTGAQFGAFFHNVINEAGESYMLFTLSGAEASQFDFGMPSATAVFHPTFANEGVIRSEDITRDPRYGLSAPHFGMPKGHLPVRSYLAVSVVSRSGEVIGGLFFGHEEAGRFSARHEQLMTGIAAQAAIAMDNARLFQAAQRELANREQAEQALRTLNETLEQRVAAEVERRAQAEDALRQAQKMETLGQLTGGVAHDFNNLLQIVSGNLEILQRNLPEGEKRLKRAAENAARGAERAAVLTQRLLAFSRRQPLAPKPIDANRLVTGMSELLHRSLGETIAVETVLAAGLWPVEADPNQLENAILNLAVNARDAMPGGGKLTVETANTHLDRRYASANAGVVTGQYVAICVSDTGAGMDAETVARAFEPFFTTKEVGKGTGLGLSMVYGFVKQSGGHLQIYSEVGQGTSVKIYLPRLLGEGPEQEVEAAEAAPEGARDETILVCEDDEDVRAYTVEVLRELGYRVVEAADGAAALRLLQDPGQRVDLLFTDVVLPGGMSGAVMAREAQALRPGLKTLFTTGYARDAIVHQGRLDAGVELITKPFSYSDLAARVRDLLDGAA